MKKQIVFLFLSLFVLHCQNSALFDGANTDAVNVKFATVFNGDTQVMMTWECSSTADGYIIYSGPNKNGVVTSIKPASTHALPIQNLSPNTDYTAYVGCGKVEEHSMLPVKFTTWVSSDPPKTRGIWIVGGIGSNNSPVGQIDLFDPVKNAWYSNVTHIPTPRAFSSVVSYKNKIFVIGGISNSGGTFSVSSLVEVYDPFANTWQTYSSVPDAIQGGVAITSGNQIYIVGNALDTNISVGYPVSRVYELFPEVGTGGTWIKYQSLTAIFSRVDMSACSYNGSLFFTGGRQSSDGSASVATSDAYIPASNATTSFNEPSLNAPRSGAATACYRPGPSDPFPGDAPAVLVVGGSTATSLLQPAGLVNASNLYDYYALGTSNTSFQAGPVFPISVYYPAMEISYDLREAFVFGGATSLNLPSNVVYSIGLSNPIGGPWTLNTTQPMPVSRYGHKAIILNR